MSNIGRKNSPPPPYSYTSEGEIQQKVPPNSIETNSETSNFPPHPQFNPTVPPYPTGNPIGNNGLPPTIGSNQQPIHPTRVVVARTALFGPFPVEMDCPYCHTHIVTHTSRVPGLLPWIILGVCFVLGFFLLFPWCLCCLPFCIDACLDVLHSCPGCKRIVGRFARL